jgi:hypothetical protein
MPDDDHDTLNVRDDPRFAGMDVLPPEEQPSGIGLTGTLDIQNFQGNRLVLFVDESNRLCVRGPDGSVNYLVVSSVPADDGAIVVPPTYVHSPPPKRPVATEPVAIIANPRTLWDHLKDGKDGQ